MGLRFDLVLVETPARMHMKYFMTQALMSIPSKSSVELNQLIIVQYYRRDFNRQAKLFIEVVGRVWPLLEQITGQFKGQCQRLLIIERDRPLNKATTSTHYVYVNTSHCLFCPLSRHTEGLLLGVGIRASHPP